MPTAEMSARRQPGPGRYLVQQHLGRGQQRFGVAGRGFARDRLAGDEVAGEVDHDGRVVAVRELHSHDDMGTGPDPKRHGRAAAARLPAVAGCHHLLEKPQQDEFRRDRGDRCRAYAKLLGDLYTRDETGRAHPLEDLLAERAHRFGQRGDHRPHPSACVTFTTDSGARIRRYFFATQRKIPAIHPVQARGSADFSAPPPALWASRVLPAIFIWTTEFIIASVVAFRRFRRPGPRRGRNFGRTANEEKNASRRCACRDLPHAGRLCAGYHRRR